MKNLSGGRRPELKFRLEEWLKSYKPRVVVTNMVTKRNNVNALQASIGKARAVATRFRKGNRNPGHCLPITDPDTGETYPTRKAFCEANNITISAFDYSMRVCGGDLTAAIRRMKTPPGERTPAIPRGPSGRQSGNRQKLQHLGGDRGGLRDPGIDDLPAESPRAAAE